MRGVAQPNAVRGRPPLALVLLTLALSLSASRADLLSCAGSFHERSPPAHVAESGLKAECHTLGGGRSFATLHHPGCGDLVYAAFHLSADGVWGRGAALEADEGGTEDAGKESAVFVPALYKRGRNADPPASASPLQKMDALTAEVVESRVIPLCSKAGGDVYVQSGVGGLNECQAGLLWSAVCCSVPSGSGSFSVGMTQQGGEELRTVSVEELEQRLGVHGIFSGGCGEGGGQAEEEVMSFLKERVDRSHAHSQHPHVTEESVEREEEQAATRGGEEAETSSHAATLGDEARPVEASESEDGGVLLYILSSIVSLLCAPFCVAASTLTDLLSRFAYVLWEDAAVLAALPVDSLVLAWNLGSGVASGVESTCDVAYRLGETGVASAYACVSTLGGALLLSFYEGVVGTGTLAYDVLGLATWALEQGLEVGVAVVGWAGQQLGEYLGTVGSEMMQQSWMVGEGVGTLAWRSQKGVCHLFQVLGGIMGGVVENTVENVQEAFGGE